MGIVAPSGRYSTNTVVENILATVRSASGQPMRYHDPHHTTEVPYARAFLATRFRDLIHAASKIPEWRAIDDYTAKAPTPRQLNKAQTAFLFRLFQKQFDQKGPNGEELRSTHNLIDSGLTPQMLDDLLANMFPVQTTTT